MKGKQDETLQVITIGLLFLVCLSLITIAKYEKKEYKKVWKCSDDPCLVYYIDS